MPQNNLVPAPFPDVFKDVVEFMMIGSPEMEGQPFGKIHPKTIQLAIDLIKGEAVSELLADLQKFKDSGYSIELSGRISNHCVDTIYVCLWTMKVLALPWYEEWANVQEANMRKFPIHEGCKGLGCDFMAGGISIADDEEVASTTVCRNGRLVTRRNSNGKVMKPEGWYDTNSFETLYNYWNRIVQAESDKIEQDPHTRLKGFQQLDYHEEKPGINSDLRLKKKEEEKKGTE